jgi:hypothetical protein
MRHRVLTVPPPRHPLQAAKAQLPPAAPPLVQPLRSSSLMRASRAADDDEAEGEER